MLKSFFVVAAVALLLVGVAFASGDDHDHEHEHEIECACAAQNYNFVLNCTDMDGVMASWNTLVANNCVNEATCKGESICTAAYYHVEAHHDHCLGHQTPEVIEKGIHDYEVGCENCRISRQYDPALQKCDTPTCSASNYAVSLYDTLTAPANNCSVSCSSTACSNAFKGIRAFHDLCDESDIPIVIEQGIHDYEDVCAAYGCNSVDAAFTPTCTASPTSASFAVVPAPIAVALTALVAALVLVLA